MCGGCIFSHSPWTPRLRSHGPARPDHRRSSGLGGAIWMALVSHRCACNEDLKNGEVLKTTSQRFPAIFPFTLRRSSLTSTVCIDGAHSCLALPITLSILQWPIASPVRLRTRCSVIILLRVFSFFLLRVVDSHHLIHNIQTNQKPTERSKSTSPSGSVISMTRCEVTHQA